MKMCQQHWDQLRQAVEEAGLGHLVPTSGEEAVRRMAEGDPDPLMGAHNAIVMKSMEIFGIRVLVGEECPLCMVVHDIEHCTCGKTHTREEGVKVANNWIERSIECVQNALKNRGVSSAKH